MAFLVNLPWTCLCGVASALARTIKVLIAQDRTVDSEKGTDSSAQQDTSQSGPLAAVFSAEVLITMQRTITVISQSICRSRTPKTSEVDIEKGDPVAELTPHPLTCESPLQSTPECEAPTMINNKENENDSGSDCDNIPPSPTLSISSILDLMPIPVTTQEQRALAASILATRTPSPSPPNTPSLSPCTDASHDSSFPPDLDASTVLNTPLTVDEPMLSSPTQVMHLTPFLEQQSALSDPQGHDVPAIDESESHNTPVSQDISGPWAGETGFKFSQTLKAHKSWRKRNTIQFIPPFPVVEEEEECEETIKSGQRQQISDSPWDNGINETYGLKGRAFWKHAMKFSDSADDQLWIDNGLQVETN